MWWLLKERFVISILLQWKLFSDVFQQLLKCLVFSEVPKPGELIQVAGYVFIQGTSQELKFCKFHLRTTSSIMNEKKCSLNNAYRLAGTARSTGIAELRIVNEVTYESTLERLGDPKLSVKRIEQECRRQLGDLLPFVKQLRIAKRLLPMALDDAFYS